MFQFCLAFLPFFRFQRTKSGQPFWGCPQKDVLFSSLDKWEIITPVIPFHRSFSQTHIFHTMDAPSQLLLMK